MLRLMDGFDLISRLQGCMNIYFQETYPVKLWVSVMEVWPLKFVQIVATMSRARVTKCEEKTSYG